jgi:hypothetical protein
MVLLGPGFPATPGFRGRRLCRWGDRDEKMTGFTYLLRHGGRYERRYPLDSAAVQPEPIALERILSGRQLTMGPEDRPYRREGGWRVHCRGREGGRAPPPGDPSNSNHVAADRTRTKIGVGE